MSAQIKVPKLRFPEFSGDWEEKKLGTITSKIGSGSTPSGGEKVYSKEGIFFIRSQNVNNNKLDLLDKTFISQGIHKKMKGSTVLPNDVLLNITGASIGRSCVVPNIVSEANVNQHVCIIRGNKTLDSHFLQSFFASHKGQNLVYQGQTGSGREGLNFQSIASFKISIPTIEEQTKIATFLIAIDTKIDQLTKKKTLLKQYKKGVMQKIFAREIRFCHDDGSEYPEWVEKKLGEVLKIGSGRDYKHLGNGNIPVFGTGGYMLSVDDYLYDGETVCIGRKGTIDKPMFFSGKIWTVDTLFYTHSFKNSIPKYIYFVFQLINWKKYNEASGVPSLSKSTIETIKINLPSLKEQIKIASLLTAVDKKISHVQMQLEHTKQFKKALLQKMFV